MTSRERDKTLTLGERLKKRREELGLGVKDLADEIQSPQKYIEALEIDNYDEFSAKVYAKGYLKKFLAVLHAENQEELMNEFDNEWEVRMFHKRKDPTPLPENRGRGPILTPVRMGLGAGAIFLLFLLGFLGFRLNNFLMNSTLEILEPSDNLVISEPWVRIKGEAEKESRLTVSGREIRIDEDGSFDEVIELSAGLNSLEFLLENRFGKITKEVKHVLVK